MRPNSWLITFTFVICFGYATIQSSQFEVKYLRPGKKHASPQHSDGLPRLSVYCYHGVPKHLLHMWQTVNLHIDLEANDFTMYRGSTSDDVLKEYDNHQSFWTFNIFSQQNRNMRMNPFNISCIGVETAVDHHALLHIIRIDFWRLLTFAAGVLFFMSGPKLSSNSLFYYICGITLGVTASFLVVIYFFSKLIPTKPAVYGFLAGGWTIGVYLLRVLWQNMRVIFLEYQSYLLAYMSLSAVVSFAVCYRFGPLPDPRTKNLIQWAIQVAGLCLMFFSSELQEASMGCVLILLGFYNFPSSWMAAFMALWRRTFPPKPRLLSVDEYHEEGARETVKALDDLRKHCSSPECNQWRTFLKLKDPNRFAQFMEGESHLSDTELMEYELDGPKLAEEVTDDSDSFEDD